MRKINGEKLVIRSISVNHFKITPSEENLYFKMGYEANLMIKCKISVVGIAPFCPMTGPRHIDEDDKLDVPNIITKSVAPSGEICLLLNNLFL